MTEKNIPFEERPLDIVKYPALVIYQIEFKKQGPAYHTADIQHVKGKYCSNFHDSSFLIFSITLGDPQLEKIPSQQKCIYVRK